MTENSREFVTFCKYWLGIGPSALFCLFPIRNFCGCGSGSLYYIQTSFLGKYGLLKNPQAKWIATVVIVINGAVVSVAVVSVSVAVSVAVVFCFT